MYLTVLLCLLLFNQEGCKERSSRKWAILMSSQFILWIQPRLSLSILQHRWNTCPHPLQGERCLPFLLCLCRLTPALERGSGPLQAEAWSSLLHHQTDSKVLDFHPPLPLSIWWTWKSHFLTLSFLHFHFWFLNHCFFCYGCLYMIESCFQSSVSFCPPLEKIWLF